MIELHHLNESRSRRITWLLEELGLEYKIVKYQRDPKTRLAPPALLKIHPLGKAPVIRDGDEVIFESGAIVEYLIRRYGNGRLAPTPDTSDYNRYIEFLHYAEGSAMLPLLLKFYTSRLGEAATPLWPRIDGEMQNHLGFLNDQLASRDFFVGNELTGADIQLIFVTQFAERLAGEKAFPHLAAFNRRMAARPAYRRAMEKGGE
ncbi:glutathione S-transferase [Rhodanobacter sp. ANJX3]|uniref:glutathione S-transferase family protein n=1 Tax=Rhodanobacter sp. ANJX3 TaxID=2723083 RepID=UPI001613D67F|nr:glutathione S-transferase family protein [Rhodanobacter sp. ANJX3]MBB5357120.1 glutathione S-transferase [Rhodanobacter sp. ANJX3]